MALRFLEDLADEVEGRAPRTWKGNLLIRLRDYSERHQYINVKREKPYLIGLSAGLVFCLGLLGYAAVSRYDQLLHELSHGNVTAEAMHNIQAKQCLDGKIKQKIRLNGLFRETEYCIFTTSDETKPYIVEPYSDKCECKE